MHILVADDCDDVRFLAKKMLSRAGHVVDVVNDGGQALRVLTEQPHAYDMVVLDQDMPVQTGLSVLETVRSQGNDIAVVIHSGSDCAAPAARLGATFVPKDPVCEGLVTHIGPEPASDPPP